MKLSGTSLCLSSSRTASNNHTTSTLPLPNHIMAWTVRILGFLQDTIHGSFHRDLFSTTYGTAFVKHCWEGSCMGRLGRPALCTPAFLVSSVNKTVALCWTVSNRRVLRIEKVTQSWTETSILVHSWEAKYM